MWPKGAAEMVRQMVGEEVPLAFCRRQRRMAGSAPSVERDPRRHRGAPGRRPASPILVDLGGAETNSEMAIELLADDRRTRVVVCNAPIVEGAVIAAAEASGGSPLDIVKQVAEELSPQ